jgi:cobalt/nickel transport protein
MKKLLLYSVTVLVLVAVGYFTLRHTTKAKWAGVDETVVEKYARAAGRPPHRPLIDTDQGDLLLFCFLVAGVVGGFVIGYYIREVFPPENINSKPKPAGRTPAVLEVERR